MMDQIECKEEQIDDVAYTDQNSENNLNELDFDNSITHEPRNGSSNAIENPAACHFFFPASESFSERKTSHDQEDPLALNTDSCVYQSESISIDDELLALETSQTTHLSSFLIIDPENITEPDTCESKVNLIQHDQIEEKFDTGTRKRKLNNENSFQENSFPLIKKIKLEEKPIDSISLKNALVYIGPKLPLHVCLQWKAYDSLQLVSTKTEKLSNTTTLKADQQELNQKEHIILKIYTCSKCDLKHTDSGLHEAHIATCVSEVSTPQKCCFYKDKNGLFCCEFCIFKFKQKRNLISHQNKHIKSKGFICWVCNKKLVSVKKLQNHYIDFHKNVSKIFSCNLCEYSNTNVNKLKGHMMKHNSDKHLYCYKCRQNYDSVNDFNHHICKKYEKIFLKGKKPPLVNKTGDKQSIKKHHAVKFSNLKIKFESEVIITNGIYYCNGCSYKFSSHDNLVKHKKEHLKIQPYKCYVCKYESFSVVDMGNHVKCHLSQEVKSISIKCSVCYLTFDKWQFLRRHAVSHVYDELYCSSCRINFDDSESLVQHMSSAHKHSIQDKMYSCNSCSFKTTSAQALKKHMKLQSHHEQLTNPGSKGEFQVIDSNLKCNVVPKNVNLTDGKFTSFKTFSAFKCASCKICFDSEIALKKHTKFHHAKSTLILSNLGEKGRPKLLFKCNKCNYESSEVNSLMEHTKLNHCDSKIPFTCLVCSQKMDMLKTYLSHLISHDNIPTYKCQYCKYQTKIKNLFLQHYSKHNLKRCPMCVFSTHNFDILKKHVNNQHKPRNMQAPFVCTLCPYKSSNEKLLSIHTLKFHPKEYPSLKLPIPNFLEKCSKNHDDKLYACSLCQFTNHRIYDFKRHLCRHFVNGKLRVKISETCVKKRSLALKRPYFKKFNASKKKASKIVDSLFIYACSQCDFKSKHRKSVAFHLLNTHKLNGGIRNNMILKLNAPLSTNTTNNKLRTEKNVIRCEHCEVEKFSVRAQMQHKRYGHKTFWLRPFSCLKCSCRFNTEIYVSRHECKKIKPSLTSKKCNKFKTIIEQKMKNHPQISAKSTTTSNEISKPSKPKPLQQNTTIQMLNEIEEEEQLSSGDESYSCGECNFVTVDVTELIKHMFIHSGVQDD